MSGQNRDSDRLTEVVSIGLNAIDNALSTSRPADEESVYDRTLRAFSRHRTSPGPSSQRKKRGKVARHLTFHMFLLAKKSDFLPPTTELDRLTRNGLGSPKNELPGLLETVLKKTTIELSETLTDLEDLIISSYQNVPLGQIGFNFGRVNEGKRLEEIKPTSLSNLREILKKGKLWVIPKREIILPLNSAARNMSRNETMSTNQHDTETRNNSTENSDDNEPSTSMAGRSTNVLIESSRPESTTEPPVHVDRSPTLPPLRRPASRRTGSLRRTTRRAAVRCRTNISNYAATYQRLPSGNGNAASSNLPLPMTNTLELTSDNIATTIQEVALRDDTNEAIYEVIDSEDEELQRALEESMEEHTNNHFDGTSSSASFSELLQGLQNKVNIEDKQEVIVSRRCVLKSAFHALRRKHFDMKCKLYVKFSGEMGDDHGGPRREFFRLAILELSKSSLFEGEGDFKFFSHNLQKLEDFEYRLAGRLVGLSISQDGPGIFFLNSQLYDFMTGQTSDIRDLEVQSIPDHAARDILQKLKDIRTDAERDAFLSEHGDWCLDQGFNDAWRLKIEDKDRVANSLIKQLVFYRTSAEIAQFCSGLNDVFGLWDMIKQNPKTWKDLFSAIPQVLNKRTFQTLYDIKWSVIGSNKRAEEEASIYCWEIFLQDIDEKEVEVSFEELLIFITGADKIPPAGFSNKIEISLYDFDFDGRLPFASTCALSLSLPRGINDLDKFKGLLVRSLKESSGFGKI